MRNKSVLILVGLLTFIAIVGGISYSYFIYNKNLGDVSINTGEIAINYSSVSGNLSLSNVIPMSDNDGMTTSSYIDFTVDATVDTDKIYYELYIMPKSGNTLNTDYLKTYLTNQQNVKISEVTLYKDLSNSEKSGGKTIYKGLVNINNDGSKRTYSKAFRLRLWLDDTYQETASKTFEFDIYLHAYNVQNVWADNISFSGDSCNTVQCELELLSGYTPPAICKRATSLHTETCTYTSGNEYCYDDGYYSGGTMNTTTITYGNLGTAGSTPATGDAFDCDVDGTGYNKRFYYVSNYYDTSTKTFDNTTAVLIYSSNTVYDSTTSHVIDSADGAEYATQADIQVAYPNETISDEDNWHGPVTAIKHLPTITEWNNVELKTASRTILACDDEDCSNTPVGTTGSGSNTITNPFSYTGKAARLLTLKELKQSGCDTLSGKSSLGTTGALKGCNFLLEGTNYADSTKSIYGPWLETPYASNSDRVCRVSAYPRVVNYDYVDADWYGVRPVIDVPMSRIEY